MSLTTFLLCSNSYVSWLVFGRAVRPCNCGRKLAMTWQLTLISGSTFDFRCSFIPYRDGIQTQL